MVTEELGKLSLSDVRYGYNLQSGIFEKLNFYFHSPVIKKVKVKL